MVSIITFQEFFHPLSIGKPLLPISPAGINQSAGKRYGKRQGVQPCICPVVPSSSSEKKSKGKRNHEQQHIADERMLYEKSGKFLYRIHAFPSSAGTSYSASIIFSIFTVALIAASVWSASSPRVRKTRPSKLQVMTVCTKASVRPPGGMLTA